MPWYTRWRNVFRSERLSGELDDELQFHLAETVDRLVASGLPDKEAREQARVRLGNYSRQKEKTRDMNIAVWLDTTRADLVYGLRQLRAAPGFATVAILSLALGIGANSAMFQLVDAIRLRTLPVKNPRELVSIDFEKDAMRAGSWWGRSASMTFAQWQQLVARHDPFTGVLAWSAQRFNLATGGEAKYAQGLYVSGDFFRVLGVNPILGRTFTPEGDERSCDGAAVVSHSFWKRQFSGDPAVIGRNVTIEGHPFPIIGVTPASFFGVEVGQQYDVAIPLCAERLLAEENRVTLDDRACWWISGMGRLKPGWTARKATANLHMVSPAIMRATLPPGYRPDMASKYLANKLTASESGAGVSALREQFERPLWLLMAITGLVLVIACANLANLLLARASVREPEIAVRLAIGATRARLIGQLMAESFLISFLGALGGTAVSLLSSHVLVAFVSTTDSPVVINLSPDWRLLGFTAALALLTCLLFGLLPAVRASYSSPVTAMRAGGRSVTASRERFGLRRVLVSAQVALSLVLLFGALLFVRSLYNLLTVDTGFRPEGILTVKVDFSKTPYAKKARVEAYREIHDKLDAVPGVVSAAEVSLTPMGGGTWGNLVNVDAGAAAHGKEAFFNQASPGYFRTVGTPFLIGRDFDDNDKLAAPKVAIVNEQFARAFFSGTNPIGHTLHIAADAGAKEPSFQIVGLVRNTKYLDLHEDPRPIAYFPTAQSERLFPEATYLLRTTGSPQRLIRSVKSAITVFGPSLGVEFRPLSAQLDDSLVREKLMATLSGGFGLLAALLATLGLYGVISYTVARRRNEIGVRLALGADRFYMIRFVLREAVLLVSIGLAAGTVLALWAGKAAATLLFRLQPNDAISLLAAALLIAVTSLMASYLPARRAAGLDPMTALRAE